MYRILLLDDEQNVLNALRRELEDEYEIETFNNPNAAIQRSIEAQFDLVMVDYQMPEMNGIQFLKQFARLQPDATRIILSGQADRDVLVKAINETHIYRFIDKPWNQLALAVTLAQALSYRKLLLENRRISHISPAKTTLLHKSKEPDRHYKILVVDDEANVLSTITRDLTSRSTFQDLHMVMLHEANPDLPKSNVEFRFEVYTSTSPKEALDYTKRITFDAVIVDYMMPEMNGFEFLEAFREKQPDAARIMISGHADKQKLTEAINQLEIYCFISKPWREYDLRCAVTQSIILKNLLLENRLLARESVALTK